MRQILDAGTAGIGKSTSAGTMIPCKGRNSDNQQNG
jgi:hypothetical protein